MIASNQEQNFLESLNPMQREAVTYLDGPLLVLAGAGTGKTKVLTARIANIIYQRLASPNNILAVTFTNKAAKEMAIKLNAIINSQGVTIGTFHSIAARILRSHISALDIRFNNNFTIIDQDDQIKLIKEIAANKNIDLKSYAPKLIQTIISRWKDQGIMPNKLSNSDIKSPAHKKAWITYTEYQEELADINSLDFGDLLLYNNELFIRFPELLKQYQEKYKYILIDEYQDTNAVQYVWARMLANDSGNICCVGDDDQSIYSWRGAEIGNILRFEKDFPNAKIVKLEQNYRSSSEILAAASGLIKHNKSRHGKVLWTNKEASEKIKVVSCWNDKEEARFVVAEIEKLIKSGRYKANQVAILVRAGFQTRGFEEVFISGALPYQIIGGLRFYERMEIRDLLAYIRISLNNNDNLALERIINVPKRAIGNVTIRQIKDYSNQHGLSALDAIRAMLEEKILKNKPQESLSKLVMQIDDWHQRYQNESALAVTKAILEQSGYLDALKEEKTEEARGRIENINEMLRAIDEFDNIREFIEHSSLVMENERLELNFGGAVSIMTLHAAKGLEFDLVFLPGWEEGVFPHQKSLNEDDSGSLEEERRIAYVGITRAKQSLYITFAEKRRIFGETLNSVPSRFLTEIPKEICVITSSTRHLNYLESKHSFSFHEKTGKAPNVLDNHFRPGDQIRHIQFGHGKILKQANDTLEILFPSHGVKTIKANYVKRI